MGEETGTSSGRISEKLDKLIEVMEIENREKKNKLKLPTLSGRQLKKNFVLALILRTNKEAEIRKVKIENNKVFLKDNKTYHLALSDFILNMKVRGNKRCPFMIIPEWDMQPVSLDELQNKTIDLKRLVMPQRMMIQALKEAQIEKKKGGSKAILIIVGLIAGAAIIYFIINSLTKKKA